MTRRELIEICNATPEDKCYDDDCPYQRECKIFKDTVGYYPVFLYNALDVDFDCEIEVE